MSPWRAVPVEPTEAMARALCRGMDADSEQLAASAYQFMLTVAAPAFEPTPEQVERAWNAYINAETGRGGMRAALVAAFSTKE